MASAILTSAKHGAYVAIGLYLAMAMVLVVSLSIQSRDTADAPIEVAHPGIQFEHLSQDATANQPELAGVVGA